ncbi:sulfite exporter TauE/SafE family protein [Pontibacter arcticus]|uniref:Probable membrane transporter protein n=1 Tax=Pontibacter arcticus TaxID=2080288 RepID=A0A364RJP3_9BACT|nr:TSUP family transporter [Pontibacter arcticus]RAU84495.1 sulfite exporter TauE/SafE family protein [Pontibacter arcticus]
MENILYLCLFAFLAGFIDAVVGGGGLIQLPALLIFLPGVPVATVFGTGKLASIAGTTSAMVRYVRNVKINYLAILPAAAAAFICSFLGARALSHLDASLLKPLILVLLILVAIYTFIRKDFGSLHAPKLSDSQEKLYGLLIGAAIGFYDGFFGPGTGSFLIFIFIGIFGFNFLAASAAAKVVNVATNLSALLYFGYKGFILYEVAIPMAICSVIGSQLGTRTALKKGTGFVRALFLVVVTGIILKFAYDTYGTGGSDFVKLSTAIQNWASKLG